VSAVTRDCHANIELMHSVDGQKVPVTITDRCVHGTFAYYYAKVGRRIPINATVCPCVTRLCNAGEIVHGGTAGTATAATATPSQSMLLPAGGVRSSSTRRDAPAPNIYNSSTTSVPPGNSTATTYKPRPTLIAAVFSAVVVSGRYAL